MLVRDKLYPFLLLSKILRQFLVWANGQATTPTVPMMRMRAWRTNGIDGGEKKNQSAIITSDRCYTAVATCESMSCMGTTSEMGSEWLRRTPNRREWGLAARIMCGIILDKIKCNMKIRWICVFEMFGSVCRAIIHTIYTIHFARTWNRMNIRKACESTPT